ncbi:hypothetical protein BG005_000951 [Podila minutissima]|nr:hypothetical protein BG005_000951 [Podila minutissima]
MKDEALAASLFPPAHRRQHSRTISQSHSLSRQQSPALDLPAPTTIGTITVHTNTIAFAEVPRKPKEYINVAQRKEMRKHGALRDSSYWNQLLIAARKSRGPYFCPSTRSYQVDRHSNLYWSGYSEADPIVELEQAKEESGEQTTAGDAINSGTDLKLSTIIENSTPGETEASASNGTTSDVPATSTPSEVKEESSNIGSNPNGTTVTNANNATSVNGSQSDLISPTLNPAANRTNLARNPLTSPGQPGTFPNQIVGQGLHLQQQAGNPHNLGQIPQNMMAGGFISPSSLMQPIPQMQQQLPGQMSVGMNPAFANMPQLHPQVMQNHLQQPLQQQQLLQQQMFQQQQQQQFMQQQQYQQQQQQMFSPPAEFPNPPRPKGRPRQSKNAQVQLGSPTPSHNRTPSVTWADQQQQ